MRAKMGAALRDDHPFDFRTASRTGLTGPMKNLQNFLISAASLPGGKKITLTISETRSLILQSLPQNLWNRLVQRLDLLVA